MHRIIHERDVEIDNEIIKAEYYEWVIHSDSTNKYNNLSDLWDAITIFFYRAKHKIRNLYYEIRYGFERMFNGYDSVDIFETYSKFTERYYKILIDYRKYHYGYPCGISQEEWDNIIDRMISCLYFMDEENVDKELSKDVPENWILCNDACDKIKEKHKDEFFKLFSEYFFFLWD